MNDYMIEKVNATNDYIINLHLMKSIRLETESLDTHIGNFILAMSSRLEDIDWGIKFSVGPPLSSHFHKYHTIFTR